MNALVFVLEVMRGETFVMQWSAVPVQIVSGHHWITILPAMFMPAVGRHYRQHDFLMDLCRGTPTDRRRGILGAYWRLYLRSCHCAFVRGLASNWVNLSRPLSESRAGVDQLPVALNPCQPRLIPLGLRGRATSDFIGKVRSARHPPAIR